MDQACKHTCIFFLKREREREREEREREERERERESERGEREGENFFFNIYFFFLFSADTTSLVVCGAEDRTRAARMPGERATTEPHPQPLGNPFHESVSRQSLLRAT